MYLETSRKIFPYLPQGIFCYCRILCGYPMGAKVTADLVCTKKIERSEAAYLLSFCNNTSPVFIVNFIIHKILRDRTLLVPTLIILIAVPIFLSFFSEDFISNIVNHTENPCARQNVKQSVFLPHIRRMYDG